MKTKLIESLCVKQRIKLGHFQVVNIKPDPLISISKLKPIYFRLWFIPFNCEIIDSIAVATSYYFYNCRHLHHRASKKCRRENEEPDHHFLTFCLDNDLQVQMAAKESNLKLISSKLMETYQYNMKHLLNLIKRNLWFFIVSLRTCRMYKDNICGS